MNIRIGIPVILLYLFIALGIHCHYLTQGSCHNKSFVMCEAGENWRTRDAQFCILKKYLCDNEPDCSDGSDERYCSDYIGFNYRFVRGPCPEHFVLCQTGTVINGYSESVGDKRCFQTRYICDNHNDCLDNSDEKYCPYNYRYVYNHRSGISYSFIQDSCPQDYYRCLNGSVNDMVLKFSYLSSPAYNRCIHKSWICDGRKHCSDGSDENFCPYFFPSSENYSELTSVSTTLEASIQIWLDLLSTEPTTDLLSTESPTSTLTTLEESSTSEKYSDLFTGITTNEENLCTSSIEQDQAIEFHSITSVQNEETYNLSTEPNTNIVGNVSTKEHEISTMEWNTEDQSRESELLQTTISIKDSNLDVLTQDESFFFSLKGLVVLILICLLFIVILQINLIYHVRKFFSHQDKCGSYSLNYL